MNFDEFGEFDEFEEFDEFDEFEEGDSIDEKYSDEMWLFIDEELYEEWSTIDDGLFSMFSSKKIEVDFFWEKNWWNGEWFQIDGSEFQSEDYWLIVDEKYL